ncbi:MAG: sulfite exporter TauE/SafE family protein [Bacteroidota bacterium]
MLFWVLSFLSAFLVGISKGGLKGTGPIIILLMGIPHGMKAATGIIVPLIIVGDLIAISYFYKYVRKEHIWRFLPFAVLGVLIATWAGKDLSELVFKKLLAILIILGLAIMFLWERYGKKNLNPNLLFTGTLATGAGFYSMMGNFAGSLSNIYFLLTKMPKLELIGTSTMIFFFVNLIKLPFHIFVWHTITWDTLKLDAYLILPIFIGFFVAKKIVHLISEKFYRIYLYTLIIVGAIMVLII